MIWSRLSMWKQTSVLDCSKMFQALWVEVVRAYQALAQMEVVPEVDLVVGLALVGV